MVPKLLKFEPLFLCHAYSHSLLVVDKDMVGQQGQFDIASFSRLSRLPSSDYGPTKADFETSVMHSMAMDTFSSIRDDLQWRYIRDCDIVSRFRMVHQVVMEDHDHGAWYSAHR